MNMNMTLVGQMITFLVFVAITMKYVWPHFINILEERREKIAAGLAAAEQSKKDLEDAQQRAKQIIDAAKVDAAAAIEASTQRATRLIEEAQHKAREEGKRLVELAQADIAQQIQAAKEALGRQMSALVIAGSEKILAKQIDEAANNDLLEKLIAEI